MKIVALLVGIGLCTGLAAGQTAGDGGSRGQGVGPGGEVAMVVISGASLPVNSSADFGEHVRAVKTLLADACQSDSVEVAAIAVAIDSDPLVGWAYFQDGKSDYFEQNFGEWDEVHVGRGWANALVVQHIWRAEPEAPAGGIPLSAVPQVLILERSKTQTPAGIAFGADRMVRRLFGMEQIEAWVQGGGKLPGSRFCPGPTPAAGAHHVRDSSTPTLADLDAPIRTESVE